MRDVRSAPRASQSNPRAGQRFRKPHLSIEYDADLAPVVGSKRLWGKLECFRDGRNRLETVWKGLTFRMGRNMGTGRRGGHLERLSDTSKDARGEDQLVLGETATNNEYGIHRTPRKTLVFRRH
jgi:hypothetical protein